MNIVVRADASVSMGAGHVMRCLALAAAFDDGAHVQFLCRKTDGHLGQIIAEHGYPVLFIDPTSAVDESEEAQLWLSYLGADTVDLLIVDHYSLAAPFTRAMRAQCRYIMIIDDLADRDHDCDLLLDQNLYADSESRYARRVPAQCKQMLGPAFALLRAEFYQHWATPKPNHILIGFGGSDAPNLTAQSVSVLSDIKAAPLTADIVVGAGYPYYDKLSEQVSALATRLPGVALHRNCSYMARLMQQASVMIGSGGTTHWERCVSGLPGLVITTADNQVRTTQCLADKGACDYLATSNTFDSRQLAEKLTYYLKDADARTSMALQAKALVPTDGGARAVRRIIEQTIRGE